MAEMFLDAAGNRHEQASNARIVSLVPSITETLFALGLGTHLIGRTRYCSEPAAEVAVVPDVGGTKTINVDRIETARPTHVIVNIDETPRQVAEELSARSIDVVVTHPTTVAENPGLFRLLGGIFAAVDEAERLCRRFDAAHRSLVDAARDWPGRTVLYLIWKKPWITISPETYIADMLAQAGWAVSVPGDGLAGDRYPRLDLTDPMVASFDSVLLSTEPFPFTADDAADLVRMFPAARGKTRLIDGAMMSWYGSRAIFGLAYIQGFVSADLDAPSERR